MIDAEWTEEIRRLAMEARETAGYQGPARLALVPPTFPAASDLFVRGQTIYLRLVPYLVQAPKERLRHQLGHEVLHLKMRDEYMRRFHRAVTCLAGDHAGSGLLDQPILTYSRAYAETCIVSAEILLFPAAAVTYGRVLHRPLDHRCPLGQFYQKAITVRCLEAEADPEVETVIRTITQAWKEDMISPRHLQLIEEFYLAAEAVATLEV